MAAHACKLKRLRQDWSLRYTVSSEQATYRKILSQTKLILHDHHKLGELVKTITAKCVVFIHYYYYLTEAIFHFFSEKNYSPTQTPILSLFKAHL